MEAPDVYIWKDFGLCLYVKGNEARTAVFRIQGG